MPQFTLSISGQGPLVSASLGCSAAKTEMLRRIGQPVPQSVSVQALIDTGASGTCVDPAICEQLGLTPRGSARVTTMSTGKSSHPADEYDMSVVISPGPGKATLRAFSNVPVMAFDLSAQPWKAVIGRDILEACLLIYNGPAGTFTLAY